MFNKRKNSRWLVRVRVELTTLALSAPRSAHRGNGLVLVSYIFSPFFTSHRGQTDSIKPIRWFGDHTRLVFSAPLPPRFGEMNACLSPDQWLIIDPRTRQERQKTTEINVGYVTWFFLTYSLIRVLPNASKIDFNSFPFHMSLWAVSLSLSLWA